MRKIRIRDITTGLGIVLRLAFALSSSVGKGLGASPESPSVDGQTPFATKVSTVTRHVKGVVAGRRNSGTS